MDRYQQAPDWMTDGEVDDLVALTERPEAWPAEHRRSLPLIRDLVSLWPWIIQRHKKLWDEPDAFDPERFAPGRKNDRHRFQYLPFGAGPRTCVGARFAMAEALTILAIWLAKWRFEPTPGRDVRPSGMVTLRLEGGLPLILSRR